MTVNTPTTACIVCSDRKQKRVNKLVRLLQNKFSKIYVISSDRGQPKAYTTQNHEGKKIPRKELPKKVAVAFIHASDAPALWQGRDMNADHIFKFSTDGNPPVTNGELPINRKNYPDDFAITDEDIDQVINYINHPSSQPLPDMCKPAKFDWCELGQKAIINLLDKQKERSRIFDFLRLEN